MTYVILTVRYWKPKTVPKRLEMSILVFALLSSLMIATQESNTFTAAELSDELRIYGLVNSPLNFTYADLLLFPMVSEVATLYCPFDQWEITLNWTGIPLFYLLTLAQVRPEAKSVSFKAKDGYFLNINIEEVLKPTNILALKANGTVLPELGGREGKFRLVFPCQYGYVWVEEVREIRVEARTPLEYKADMPNCSLPLIAPPLQIFNIQSGTKNFQVEAFANVSIECFNFDYIQRELSFKVNIPLGTTGFVDLIIPQTLVKGPYSVFLNETAINHKETSVANYTLIYLSMRTKQSFYKVRVVASEFWGVIPEILVEFNQTIYVSETVDFDASQSVDNDGRIVSYGWSFGDGVYGNGAVVSHSYTKGGTYQVVLNITDDDGLSNFEVLTVNVEEQIGLTAIARSVFIVIICASTVISITLLLRRWRKLVHARK
jgi:hypothetical protein